VSSAAKPDGRLEFQSYVHVQKTGKMSKVDDGYV